MSRTDAIRRIIAEQDGRGAVSIEQFIRVRARNNTEAEIRDSIDYCREIINAVPVIIDQVRKTAEERGFSNWVEPLVAHAEDYFLEAEDYLPEKQLGAFGLLDDAYVALKVLSFLHAGPDPVLKVEVDGPLDFLRQVLGDEATAKLDSVAAGAQARMRERTRALQQAARHHAEVERARELERRRLEPRSPPPARSAPPEPTQRQCGACAGSGRVSCSSCGGYGYHTQSYTRVDWEGNTEYVTDQVPCGCSGGYSTCGSCGGSGWIVD